MIKKHIKPLKYKLTLDGTYVHLGYTTVMGGGDRNAMLVTYRISMTILKNSVYVPKAVYVFKTVKLRIYSQEQKSKCSPVLIKSCSLCFSFLQ